MYNIYIILVYIIFNYNDKCITRVMYTYVGSFSYQKKIKNKKHTDRKLVDRIIIYFI